MPSKTTTQKAKRKIRRGYSPTTAAGEFVKEEVRHQKRRQHGAESRRQAVAIGLSKARRAGLPIKKAPPESHQEGTGRSEVSRRAAQSKKGTAAARRGAKKAARTRKRATPGRSKAAATARRRTSTTRRTSTRRTAGRGASSGMKRR